MLMLDDMVTGVNFTAGTTTVVTKGKLIMLGELIGGVCCEELVKGPRHCYASSHFWKGA